MSLHKPVKKALLALCSAGAFIAFSVLIVAVLVQVIGRTTGMSPVWSEELTRFALLYMAGFGTGAALMSGDLVNVDAFCDALPDPLPRYLRIFASFAVAGLCLALLQGALKYVKIGMLQKSPALGLPMHFAHFSVLLLIGLLAVFALLRLLDDLLPSQELAHQDAQSRASEEN